MSQGSSQQILVDVESGRNGLSPDYRSCALPPIQNVHNIVCVVPADDICEGSLVFSGAVVDESLGAADCLFGAQQALSPGSKERYATGNR